MDKAKLQSLFAELAKAAPEVKDLWDDMHKLLTEAEAKTGPAEESSGGGLERMLRQYSDFAPQVAIAKLYGQTDSLLRSFESLKAELNGRFTSIDTVLKSLTAARVAKGRTAASAMAELEKCMEAIGYMKAKGIAAEKITKAEKRAKFLKSAIEFLKALEAGVASEAQIAEFRKAEDEEDEEDVNISVNQVEEDEEDEESKAKAKAEGYLKAVTDIEGWITSLEKGETVTVDEKDTSSVRAKAVAAKIVKAKSNESHDASGKFAETSGQGDKGKKEEEEKLKAELTTLKARLDEVTKALGDKSTGGGAPDFKPGQEASIRDTVLKAIEDGSIPADAEIQARSLLGQYEAVAAGRLGKDVFTRNLELAPTSVKPLFTTH